MYVCIVHKSCIILHFYTSFHIKENVWNFSFLLFFPFCSLVKNGNLKTPGFYTLQVIRVFSNFLQLKQIIKIKNMREYCDLLELRSAASGYLGYKKPYCDSVSFCFL